MPPNPSDSDLTISSVEVLSSSFVAAVGGRICLRITCSTRSQIGVYAIIIVDTPSGGYPATVSVWVPPKEITTHDVTVTLPPEAGMPTAVCVWGVVRPDLNEPFVIDPYLVHRPASTICVPTGLSSTTTGLEEAGAQSGKVTLAKIAAGVGAGALLVYALTR